MDAGVGQNGKRTDVEEEAEAVAKKRVRLPVETWLEVIAWVARKELATKTSFVCRRFSQIIHFRLHEKCSLFPAQNMRRMRDFWIDDEEDARGLPQSAPPENIVGITEININYLDAKVLTFIKHLRPLVDRKLVFNIGHSRPSNIVALHRVLPLWMDLPISFVLFRLGDYAKILDEFPQLLSKCLLLDVFTLWADLRELPNLVQWLAVAREDGQPKQMLCYKYIHVGNKFKLFVDLVKQNFHSSIHPSSFLIQIEKAAIDKAWGVSEFSEQNTCTGEQLSLKFHKCTKDNETFDNEFARITRCPIDGQKALEALKHPLLDWKPLNFVHFFVEEIGSMQCVDGGNGV